MSLWFQGIIAYNVDDEIPRYPFAQYIIEWIRHVPYKVWNKITHPSKTSTVNPLKFGKR